jgi:hypothetical protein
MQPPREMEWRRALVATSARSSGVSKVDEVGAEESEGLEKA